MTTHAAQRVVTGSRRPTASVSDPILPCKVTAPGVPDWVLPRPRITKLIARGTRRGLLTAVTGPVGAGKTMAAALWAAAKPGPVAWVSVDEYDNRPGVFWSYVLAALRRSGRPMPEALSGTPRGRSAEHLFLLRLASVLADQNPPVTLVVDDFHLLTAPRVLNGLDFLLRNAEAGIRLVACSRTDPLLPLHRYRLAGQLAEVRGGDLAFSKAEADQLLAQHGCKLPASSVECLTRQTEGWAAGLRLAAMSVAAHPDPGQFVRELVTEESPMTGYLVQEVLDTQPSEVREVLLSTSILERVNAGIVGELAGNAEAGRVLPALARGNAFVQPVGGGWYRYHTLFGEMLRLKLRLERPGRTAVLHRHAARWYQRNGQLIDAVRHAVQAGDWQLAASMVIEGLAISEIIEPAGSPSLADEFVRMPDGEKWPEPQPYLVSAALALSTGQHEPAAESVAAAQALIGALPPEQATAAQLTAAMIRLAVSRRAGDPAAVAQAAADTEALACKIPGGMRGGQPATRARVLAARGAAELWSGRFDEAARILDSGADAAALPGDERVRADCLSHLALLEALRGRLGRAARLAHQAATAWAAHGQPPRGPQPHPAALTALAWVHLEHHELRETRNQLKQLDGALGASPDRFIGAVAWLAAAYDGLARGQAEVAVKYIARARAGASLPGWLEHRLSLAESRALAAAGDIEAALAAAKRAGCDSSPEAAITVAHAWTAARDGDNARCTLAPVLAAGAGLPERLRLQACLVDARLSYRSGDRQRGRQSLRCALRLAEREQLRLPFAMERGWIGPVLRRDPELAAAHQHLLTPAMPHAGLPARPDAPVADPTPAAGSLTKRELQVLRGIAGMLTTAEVASQLCISPNTVKCHIKNICHKLAAARRGEAVRRARQLQLI